MKKDPLDDLIAGKTGNNTNANSDVDELDALIAGKNKAPTMRVEKPAEPDEVTADDLLRPSPSAESRASLGFAPTEADSVGYTKQQLEENAARSRANTPEAQDPLAQSVLSGVLGAGAGSLATTGAQAAGLPTLAHIIGGATAGGTSAAASGADAKGIAKGAGFGAIFGVPAAAQARVAGQPAAHANSAAMPFIRAGNEAEQRALLDVGVDKVAGVVDKYKLGTIKDPLIARDAATEGQLKALDALSDAKRTLATAKAMNNHELAREAMGQITQAQSEVNVFNALQAPLDRAATAHQMRQSWFQKLADKPIATVKNAAIGVAGAPVSVPLRAGAAIARPMVSAADKALATLIRGRQLGNVTPQMILDASAAGVAPYILGQFKPTTQAQGAPAPQLPPTPFK